MSLVWTPRNLYVTCYIGNKEFDIPKDTEAAELWTELFAKKGIATEQVDIGSEADWLRQRHGQRPHLLLRR